MTDRRSWRWRKGALWLVVTLTATRPSHAQGPSSRADTSVRLTFGGFIDGYFAYDFNRPRSLDRAFTTQAARHDEFNINLAFLDATLAAPRVRGRFAAQFGTAVQANYSSEPRVGTLSGPDVSRFIQEAFVGYRLAPSLWVDGGVFFSPFGSENWISRDNWTYTRSLIADYSPYYEAGVKATWQATPKLEAQLHVINGWQNISETNSDKAIGARLDFHSGKGIDLAYDAFVGNEAPDTARSQLRVWQEGIVQLRASAKLEIRSTLDYGMQARGSGGGTATWRGGSAVARYRFAPAIAMAGRVEAYSDPEQMIVVSGQPSGLRARGGSFTIDVAPNPRLLWRCEFRLLHAREPLFPARASGDPLRRSDGVLVTSVALTL